MLHIAEKSRPDLAYAAMRLTSYNANSKAPCFKHYIKLCVICGITLMFQSCTHVKTERKNLYQSTLKMERQKSYRSQVMNQMIQIWKPRRQVIVMGILVEIDLIEDQPQAQCIYGLMLFLTGTVVNKQ